VTKLVVIRPVLYAFILIATLVATYAFKLRTQGIFACPASGYPADGYLGYCNASAYGDYDHGALWFGMEPEAARHAAAAEVLFIGNSRMEFGFSSAATSDWFAAAGASHYLLGFSHLENETFAAPLLARFRPQARVYVINVDRFFDDEESAPGAAILHGSDMQRRYSEKRLWQRLHRPLCARLPRLCGTELAFYRFRQDGHWLARGGGPDHPQPVAEAAPSEREQWDHYAALARQFVSKLPVDRSCVILTVVPSPATKRAEAYSIAAALGLELIDPQPQGLETFDETHLSVSSAQRWSAAFFEAAGPRIRRCLAGTPGTSAG
jgi:hypothetical protein